MQVTLEDFHIFAMTGAAVFIEASPFLLLGALVSGFFEEFVPSDLLARHVPTGPIASIIFGLGMGFLIPTCDCGAMPLTRRLLGKGFPPGAAIAYMLAAPVLNPVVLPATYIAFRGDLTMVGARLAVVALVAGITGFTLRRQPDLLRPDAAPATCGCGHDHTHAAPAPVLLAMSPAAAQAALRTQPQAGAGAVSLASRVRHALEHAAEDFLETGKYLLLGAMVASAFKTFVPGDAVAAFASNVFLSVGAMIVLAVLISICSTADSFIAASFTIFPNAAKLAFITLGPMLDLKLLILYGATFKRRVFLTLAILPLVLVYIVCLTLGLSSPNFGGVLP